VRAAASPILDAQVAQPRTGGASFALRLRLSRVAFLVCWMLLAAWTPPFLHGWRRLILRAFGARIGRGVFVYGSTRIWYPPYLTMGDFATLGPRVNCYNQAPIGIGAFAIVSQGATLCAGTHDYEDPDFQLRTRPIVLGANCWIAAEAFVGPGVRVGDFAVLGARGVAMRSLEANTIHAGNPAMPVKRRALGAGRARG
jgi:putative colanic acid biosynthesis acetyltransferase WcaF